jgi:glycosyltransferase involved in cell wall biosynthesis
MKIILYSDTAITLRPDMEQTQGMGTGDSGLLHVAKALAVFEDDVMLFSRTDFVGEHEKVKWHHIKELQVHTHDCDFLIVYRRPEIPAGILADKIMFWSMDDTDSPIMQKFKENASRFDMIVGLSAYHQMRMMEAGADLKQLYVVPPGIVFDHYVGTAPKEKEFAVCYASAPFKGLPLLGKLWPRIVERNPGLKLKIFSGMRLYEAPMQDMHFQKLYDDMKAMPGVEFIGTIPQKELIKEMAKCKLMVYPNFFPETFGNVVQECIYAGTPVITSSRGALREVVKDAGMLVSGDPKSKEYQDHFVECVTMALQDKELYSKLHSATIRSKAPTWAHIALHLLNAAKGVRNGN